MSRVLGVGIATLDIINEVDHYPREDEELRARGQDRRRGGNATNTLVVLRQLGHHCAWAGMLPREPDAEFVREDLERHAIDLDAVERPARGKLPVSCILLNRATGSRTIVHYRDLPEYSFSAFQRIDLGRFDWIHFEGRAVPRLEPMLRRTREAGVPCSLEVEKPRGGIEALFELADLLLFSRSYARWRGFEDAEAFLERAAPVARPVFLAWGEQGAWCRTVDGRRLFREAPGVEVLDTLGAGDVFNAAVVHGRLRGWPPERILESAVRLAAAKCARPGLEGLGEVIDG